MPNPTPPAPQSKQAQPEVYRITATADQSAVGANGQLIQVKRVWFETMLGDTGHVDIPKSQFTADTAKKMVEAEIDQLLTLRGV